MTPDSARAHYRRMMNGAGGEEIAIRIYTGTGSGRPYVDHTMRARVRAYEAQELVGPIVQGDFEIILLAEDVTAAGVTLSTGANCKAFVRSKEAQIKRIDDNTRRINGTLVAYEMTAGR